MATREYLIYLAPLAFLTGLIAGGIKSCVNGEYDKLLNLAEITAAKNFGDYKSPLTEGEKRDWYKFMGIEEGREPSEGDLRRYLRYSRN